MRFNWRKEWGISIGVAVGVGVLLLRQLLLAPAPTPVNWVERGVNLLPKKGETYRRLGEIFERGQGVLPNWWLAFQFYQQGCRLGDRESCHREARLLERQREGAQLIGGLLRKWVAGEVPVEGLIAQLRLESPLPLWIGRGKGEVIIGVQGPRGWTPCLRLKVASTHRQLIPDRGRALPLCQNLLHWAGF